MRNIKTSLRFATYNIHACVGADSRFNPQRIVKVLQEIDADLYALQEVEHHPVDGYDLLDYLAHETGLTAIAGPTLLRETRDYGNAILTKLPIISINRIDLSQPGREPRGALDVSLDWDGESLQVVATHLGLLPGERRRQVRLLLTLFDRNDMDVSVLMGDLNEWYLWGRILNWLHAYFEPTPAHATFPSRWPIIALDRMWVHPHHRLKNMKVHYSAMSLLASDHLPLKCTITNENQ